MNFIISLSVFYYIYLVAIAVFLLFSLFNIYHLVRFGFLSFVNILVIIVYILIAVWFLSFSFGQLAGVDWSRPIFEFNNISSLGGFFNINFKF